MTEEIRKARKQLLGAVVGTLTAFIIPALAFLYTVNLEPVISADGIADDGYMRGAAVMALVSPIFALVVLGYYLLLGVLRWFLGAALALSIGIGCTIAILISWSIVQDASLSIGIEVGAILCAFFSGSLGLGTLGWYWVTSKPHNQSLKYGPRKHRAAP